MKIQELPNKESLTHFNVQYYNNGSGQGSATHVVQVTYSTNPDPIKARMKHNQRVVKFNLKDENKAINRLVKDHLGEEAKAEVKATIKELKKFAGITAWFGFRRVQYSLKHKFVKGAVFHKNTIDASTYVYLMIHADNTVNMRFMWAGEMIDVPMTQQVNPVPGQSLMYAYWTPSATKEEVTQRIKDLKHGKIEHEQPEVAVVVDGESAITAEAEFDERDYDVCFIDEVAGIDGDAEASEVCTVDPTPTAKARPVRKSRDAKPAQHPGDFTDYQDFGYKDGFGMVDQQRQALFSDEPARFSGDLGTSIRF